MNVIKSILTFIWTIASISYFITVLNPYAVLNELISAFPTTINFCTKFISLYEDNVGYTIMEIIFVIIVLAWIIQAYIKGFNDGIKNNEELD